MKNNKTRTLCEAAIFIAMAEILSFIKLYEFPNGGSVTLEMLPIILFAVRYGCGWGAGAGFVFGTVTYLIGNKFSIDWTTIICDYFLAFTALGFGAGLSSPEDPDVRLVDFTGRKRLWIEVGQPLDRPLLKASQQADAVAEYVAAALRIIDDDAQRVALARQALALDIDRLMFGDASTPRRSEVVDAVWWAYRNHDRLVADDRRVVRPADWAIG